MPEVIFITYYWISYFPPQNILSRFHPLRVGRVLANTVIIIFLRVRFVQHLDHCILITSHIIGRESIHWTVKLAGSCDSFLPSAELPAWGSFIDSHARIKITLFLQGLQDTLVYLFSILSFKISPEFHYGLYFKKYTQFTMQDSLLSYKVVHPNLEVLILRRFFLLLSWKSFYTYFTHWSQFCLKPHRSKQNPPSTR